MTATDYIISWNNFTAWINDKKYQWQPWRYYKWFNVDTRRFDVTPSKTNTLLHTYPTRVNAIFNTSIIWWNENIVWAWDWELYVDDVLEHSLSTWDSGNWIWTMKVWWTQYLYFFNDEIPSYSWTKKIHRATTSLSTVTEWYRTYTSTTWNDLIVPPNWMVVISEWFRILFSHYNNIFSLNDSEVVTKLIEFPSNENVVAITQFQGQYKIYTSTWFTTGKIYTWDWSSNTYDISLDLNWLYIESVINDWAYDYMIADNWFYQVAWVQYIKLYDNIKGKFLKKVWDDIYLNLVIDASTQCLAVYGSLPWYAKSITPKYIIDTTDLSDGINNRDCFTFNSGEVFYIQNAKLFKVWWTWTTTTTNSYIESLVFIWDNIRFEKWIEMIDLKFSWTTANCYLQLFIQIQESWTWIKLWEWKNADLNSNNHWFQLPKKSFLNPIWNFNTIRFKLNFVSNWITQCKFYWLDLYGKQDIWK